MRPRESSKGLYDDSLFLGPATHRSHESELPMAVAGSRNRYPTDSFATFAAAVA